MSERARPIASGRWRLLLLTGILFVGSAYFYQDPEWNGNSRLDLTRAIVEQGTLTIDQYQSLPQWETGDKAYFNDHFYSDKAIGSSVLAVPFYFLLFKLSTLLGIALDSTFIKHFLTTVIQGGAFVGVGLSMYLVAERMAGSAWKALIPTLALSFGTMLWPYSAVYYGHVLAAAFLAIAFCLLFFMGEKPGAMSAPRVFAVGLSAGLAFMTEYTTALIILGLIPYAIFVLRKHGRRGMLQSAGFAIAGAAVPLALVLAYNARVYGSVLATGYAYEVENRFAQGMSEGILGIGVPNLITIYHITLDPQFGIFWESPVLLLAPFGYLLCFRSERFRAAGVLSLYAVLAMLAMNGGYYLWWGGSAFGPRLMIPGLPFLIVPLAAISEALAWLVAALGSISAAQMLIPLVGQIQFSLLVYRPHREMFYVANAPFTGFSLLYDYGLTQIARQYQTGQAAWTLGSGLGIPYLLSVPALVLAEAALIVSFQRLSRRWSAGSGREATPGRPGQTERPPGSSIH